MKKLALLTSILALAACGGGSGGGGSAPVVPDVPDIEKSNFLVDADTGLGMIDINETREAKVKQAIAIANDIESENSGVDFGASLARSAGVRAASTAGSDITTADIDNAYSMMQDIFINHNFGKYTNHDVLVALSLIYPNKDSVMEFLGQAASKLDERIKTFIDGLKEDDKFARAASSIYDDFGKEFTTTLKDAKFYTNSDGSEFFTFKFDGDKLVGLKPSNNPDGGFAQKPVKGFEYTFNFEKTEHTSDKSFGGTVELSYSTEPSEKQLKTDLMEKIRKQWGENNGWDEEIYGQIQTLLDNAKIQQFEGEEEISNQIVKRKADYTDQMRIDSGNTKDLGLKYSDFGLLFEELIIGQDDDMLAGQKDSFKYTEHNGYIGGYESNQADKPETETTFTGKAYAGLTRKTPDKDMESLDDLDVKNQFYHGDATLTVDKDAKQQLVADFTGQGWYAVTVDNDQKISFDARNNNIEQDWQVSPKDPNGQIENYNVKYYGPTKDNATEVVGNVQYLEDKGDDNGDWGFKADITFGAKKN